MTQKNNAKDQVERENAAAAETESTLVEAVAQEIESRSMKRSSTLANQRVFQLSLSIDVRTGGCLHPVGVMMERKAMNVSRRQESDFNACENRR